MKLDIILVTMNSGGFLSPQFERCLRCCNDTFCKHINDLTCIEPLLQFEINKYRFPVLENLYALRQFNYQIRDNYFVTNHDFTINQCLAWKWIRKIRHIQKFYSHRNLYDQYNQLVQEIKKITLHHF